MATAETIARWTTRIDDQERSGLSPKDYAEKHGINRKSLDWWRWKLGRSQAKSGDDNSFMELTICEPVLTPEPVSDGVHLILEDYRAHLVVDAHTDLHLVRCVMDALC
jgi:hypothetical protein